MRTTDRTVILIISNIISSANVLLLSILFARMLSKTDYGTYIQMQMLIGPLVLILALGLPPSLVYFLPKNYNRRYLILRTLKILLLVGIICWLLLTALNTEISIFLNNSELEKYVSLAGICVACSLCFQTIRPVLLYRGASTMVAKINIIKALLFFSSMTACLITMTTMGTLLMVLAFNYGIDFIIATVIIGKDIKLYEGDTHKRNVTLKDQFKYGIPLALVGIFWLLGREIDKYIVSHFMTPANLAVYSRGAIELPLVHIFSSTIAQVHLPKWVSLYDAGRHNSLIEDWHSTIKKTALIMFPMFVILSIVGRQFIVLLYSTSYIDSAIIFAIYLFQLPLQITAYSAVVQATGKNMFIFYGYIGQIALNIVVSVYLIKLFGSIGPAIATVSSLYLFTFYILLVITKIFGTTLKSIFPWKHLTKILSASLSAGFVPALLHAAWESGMLERISWSATTEFSFFIEIVILTALYVTFCGLLFFKFQILDRNDKETIYRWLMINRMRSFLAR